MQEEPLAEAAEELRVDGVYVDPEVSDIVDENELEALVEDAGTPIYVAVLPESPRPRPLVIQELQDGVGRPGTYALLDPDGLEVTSDFIEEAPAIAGDATADPDSPNDAITEFVTGVADEAQSSGGDEDGGVPGWLVLVMLLAVAGGLAWLVARRRRKERERQAAVREARESLRPSLSLLAEDVLALEPEVALHEEARGDYDEAVRRYRFAEAAIGNVRTMQDTGRVQRVLDEGTYAMARVRAIVDGREPPGPPPELQAPGPNQEPPVVVGDDGRPGYAGWDGGWYGGGWFGGNLATGLLLGSMLGGPGWGGGYGGGDGGSGDGGDGGSGDGGGGDWGGGDWGGGGDFGGGDFGGGDFGGGDFGG